LGQEHRRDSQHRVRQLRYQILVVPFLALQRQLVEIQQLSTGTNDTMIVDGTQIRNQQLFN
tara:strand:- start:31614 stop:31796 length:183 start_codon:yes stop_codon:yes gene_type:complete